MQDRVISALGYFALTWTRYTKPLVDIGNPDDRRKSRLMASLSLAAIIFLIPVSLVWIITTPLTFIELAATLASVVVVLVTYFLSRQGHYKASSGIIFLVGSAVMFYSATGQKDPYSSLEQLHYFSIIVLFCTLFFSLRTTIIAFCIGLVGMLLAPLFVPGITLRDAIGGPLNFNLVTGAIVLLVTHHRDLLEFRRKLELAESERQRKRAEELSLVMVNEVAVDGTWRKVVPSMCKLLGYTESELLKMSFKDVTHPDDIEEDVRQVGRLLRGEIGSFDMEKRFVCKNGAINWIYVSCSLVSDDKGTPLYFLTYMRDINQARVAEQALRASEAKNSALINAIPDMLFINTRDGVFLDAHSRDPNRPLIPPDKTVGQNIRDILPPEVVSALFHHFDLAVETGEMQIHEYPLPGTDGNSYFEARILAFDNDKLLSVIRDITDRKRSEARLTSMMNELEQRVAERTADLVAANDRLKELDRLKSKFIADISHELRTPLATLNLRVYLLEKDKEKTSDHIRAIKGEMVRLNELLKDILSFSETETDLSQHDDLVSLNLNELTEDALASLRGQAEASKQVLLFEPGPDLPAVRGKTSALARVIINLISNAIKYTPQKGQITVKTLHVADSNQVKLEVRDTGMGIAPEDKPHLFQPFYRGQRVGSSSIPGTGLGLAMVKDIIDYHKGTIEIESEIDKGSTFRICLPAA